MSDSGHTAEPIQTGAPPVVKIALKVLLNHVEPGWENSVGVVRLWLDNPAAFTTEPAALAKPEGGEA